MNSKYVENLNVNICKSFNLKLPRREAFMVSETLNIFSTNIHFCTPCYYFCNVNIFLVAYK